MRRLLFFGLLVGLAAVLSLVLLGRHDRSAQAAVRQAAARTLDTGSSRVTITYAYEGNSISVSGVLDYRHHRARLHHAGTGVLGGDVVVDGTVVYVKPGTSRWLPAGKWLKLDAGALGVLDRQGLGLRDPSSLLRFLRLASSDVHEAGGETIGGVETTRYDGTLDFQKIVDRLPAAQRDALRAELALLSRFGQVSVGYSVWVDANGVARRLRISSGDLGAVTIDFYDFGVPAAIRVPPKSETLGVGDYLAFLANRAAKEFAFSGPAGG